MSDRRGIGGRRMAELPAELAIFDLSGRTALITGASRGLGAGAARALASAGANVALAARTEADLAAVCATIGREGGAAHAIVADVTDEAAVERMVAETVDRFGRIDIVVNNAGMNVRKPAL